MRWSAITRFMNRKQRSASSSPSRYVEPVGQLRAATRRASATASSASSLQVRRAGAAAVGSLAVQPRGVAVDDRAQPSLELVWRRRGELAHVEQDAVVYRGLGLRGLGRRQPGGPHPGRPARALGDLPVGRAGAADRELQPVAVLQIEPAQLVVGLAGSSLEHVGDRQEDRRAVAST